MLTTLLFEPSDDEMEAIEKLSDAGEKWAKDTVRDYYQRIVQQIQ